MRAGGYRNAGIARAAIASASGVGDGVGDGNSDNGVRIALIYPRRRCSSKLNLSRICPHTQARRTGGDSDQFRCIPGGAILKSRGICRGRNGKPTRRCGIGSRGPRERRSRRTGVRYRHRPVRGASCRRGQREGRGTDAHIGDRIPKQYIIHCLIGGQRLILGSQWRKSPCFRNLRAKELTDQSQYVIGATSTSLRDRRRSHRMQNIHAIRVQKGNTGRRQIRRPDRFIWIRFVRSLTNSASLANRSCSVNNCPLRGNTDTCIRRII